jgi:metal-responsive CopG/Arc/MetJ family transcriptional regulator
MSNPSIEMPDEMVAEVDNRRHSNTSRSQWVREAIQARLDAEDAGEWTTPDIGNSATDAADA